MALEQRYDISPLGAGKNWVTSVGGLPLFIRAIAHALLRSGHSESQAIEIAVGVVKNWASGGGKVTEKTRAKAAAAVAEWEKKKAESHVKRSRTGVAQITALLERRAITEAGAGAPLLPVAQPKPPVPREATLIGPHRFKGTNLLACATCQKPHADPIHKREKRHRGQGHSPVQTGHTNTPPRKRQAQKAQFAKDVSSVEPQLADIMRGVFDDQAKATLSRLNGNRGRQMLSRAGARTETRDVPTVGTGPPEPPSEPPSAPIDPGSIFDAIFWTQRIAKAVQPIYGAISALGGSRVRQQLGAVADGVDDSVSVASVTQILADRANALASQVNKTTANEIGRQLTQGVQAGEGTSQLANRVKSVFDDATQNRAETIARTEVMGAMNQAATTYAERLPAGVVSGKEWLSHHDGRTRPEHLAADGQTVPVGIPFQVGGFPMMHPGDPTAPPDEVINCRCAVAFQ
jgi:hypothetical protein